MADDCPVTMPTARGLPQAANTEHSPRAANARISSLWENNRDECNGRLPCGEELKSLGTGQRILPCKKSAYLFRSAEVEPQNTHFHLKCRLLDDS
jgi:hypothetical protein